MISSPTCWYPCCRLSTRFELITIYDSYNDDEPAKAAPVPEPQVTVPPQALPEASDAQDDPGPDPDGHGAGESHMNEEYDDDDDDIEFNLGNDSTGYGQPSEPVMSSGAGTSAQAPAPLANRPNAKEDG
jgi:hypothetical protein